MSIRSSFREIRETIHSLRKRKGNRASTKSYHKSDVGSKLQIIFKERVGAIPCGKCKQMINDLNKKNREEILLDIDNLVEMIIQNLQSARVSYWVKITKFVDSYFGDNLTRYALKTWILEACEDDKEK